MKRVKLKKCLNPDCDFYYYGTKVTRYCSEECANEMNRKKNVERVTRWRKRKKEKNESQL